MARALIAVVDDDVSVRKSLERVLHAASFDLRTYGSGAEFLEAIKTDDPKCVILDLNMPGVSGLDVLKRLSEDGAAVPVIVITGNDNELAEDECLALGARAYFVKPIDADLLLEAIERAVGIAPPLA